MSKVTKSQWSAKNPYTSYLNENYILNGKGSGKETRHIVFDLGDSGLEYKAGDALGVIPICRPDLVEEILVQCNFTGEEVVDTHLGECTLKEALSTRYEIHRLSKKWIMGLGEHFNNSSEEVEIKIIKRKIISEENGIVMLDWEGTGNGDDVPDG